MQVQTQNYPFHEGFELITDNRDSAWFVEHQNLAHFKSCTGYDEDCLLEHAGTGKTLCFNERAWTVDFLPPYRGNSNAAGKGK